MGLVGDRKLSVCTIEAPVSPGGVVAFINAYGVSTQRDDVSILQLPVHVVERRCQRGDFCSGKRQNRPGTQSGKCDPRAKRGHG